MDLRPAALLMAAALLSCSRGPGDPPPPASSGELVVAPPGALGVTVSEPTSMPGSPGDPGLPGPGFSPLLPDPEGLAPDLPMPPAPATPSDDGGVTL